MNKKEMDTTYIFIRFIQQTLIREKMNYIRNNKKNYHEVIIDDSFLADIPLNKFVQLENITPHYAPHLEEYIEDIHLSNAICYLSEAEKILLYRRYIEGIRDTEIAKELNITSQAVSKRRRKALEKIKLNFHL